MPRSIAQEDFDDDGDRDLAVAIESTDQVSVQLGDGTGSFSTGTPVTSGDGPRAVVAGTFNAGTDPDLAVANFAADTVSILLGTGATAATFGTKTDFGAGNGPRAVATGLFNAGTDVDLAVANELSGNVSVLLGSTGGTFTGPTNNAAGGSPSGVAVGDFNLDGDPDLAVANLSSDDVSILVGGSGGTFGAATAIAAGDGPRSIAVGDFNGDGDPDLAVPNENSDDVSILLGGAGAGFEPAVGVTAGNAPRSVAVADFTLDGDMDLAVANSQSDNVSVLRGGAGGSFAAPVDFAAGNEPFAVAAGDLDADGEQDLVVANITSDDISVLLNETPPNTTIDGGPGGLSNDTTPTFTFSADEPGVAFECRVDAESAVDCASPFTTAALPDGSHTFEVRATDVAGNMEPAPASQTVEIDATAPDTAVDSGPSGLSSQPSPVFAFSSSEPGSAFECRVDAAAFAACAAPFAAGVLADGAHSFEVKATDPAGNTDVTPAARAFTIDTVAPETSITAGPSGRTTDLNPTFAFAAEAGATFECRVDAAAFAACSTPFTAATLSRGPHAFEVRASDAAGNRDATPARRTFRALLRIRSLVTNAWRFGSRFTIVAELVVKAVPRGGRVHVLCRGGGCPFDRRKAEPGRRRRATLTRLLRGARLQPGAVVEVRVTARHAIGKVVRFRIRRGARPLPRTLCLPPGSSRPAKC